MKIYISASEGLNALPGVVTERLDNIIKLGYTIIICNKDGSDGLIKRHLSDMGYDKVALYCFECESAERDYGWPTVDVMDNCGFSVSTIDPVTEALISDADYGLVIWSLRDNSVLLIVSELIRSGKSALIYSIHAQRFYIVSSESGIVEMVVDSFRYLNAW